MRKTKRRGTEPFFRTIRPPPHMLERSLGKEERKMFGCDNNGIVWIVLALVLLCWCRGNGENQNGGCGNIGCGGCGGCR